MYIRGSLPSFYGLPPHEGCSACFDGYRFDIALQDAPQFRCNVSLTWHCLTSMRWICFESLAQRRVYYAVQLSAYAHNNTAHAQCLMIKRFHISGKVIMSHHHCTAWVLAKRCRGSAFLKPTAVTLRSMYAIRRLLLKHSRWWRQGTACECCCPC